MGSEINSNVKQIEIPQIENAPAQQQTTNTQFDPLAFLKKIIHPERLAENRKLIKNKMTVNEVWSVCRAVIIEFKKEANLLHLPVPITVVGDVHGNYHDLYRALMARTGPNIPLENSKEVRKIVQDRYLFLGDYIERGSRSIECICLLFALKLCYPTKYFLLRGAYENISMNSEGFMSSLAKLSEKHAEKLHKKFNQAFSWMPLAAIVGGSIFCVHGGISPHMNSWGDIEKIKRPLMELTEDRIATDLVYSDPLDYDFVHVPTSKPKFELNYLRHKSYFYNEAAVHEFCNTFKIKLIIRSHTCVPFGYRFFADRKLVTIFNSSAYQKQKNHGALLKIDDEGKIVVISLLPPSAKGKKDKAEKGANMTTESDCSGMSTRTFKAPTIAV